MSALFVLLQQTIKPAAFKGNIKLERIDLSLNPSLLTLDATTFDELPTLKYLFLRGNNFTTIDEKWISFGQRLQLLDFRDNALSCDCNADPLRRILMAIRNRTESLDSRSYTVHLRPKDSENVLRLAELSGIVNAKELDQAALMTGFTEKVRLSLLGSESELSAMQANENAIMDSRALLRLFILLTTEVKCKGPDGLRDQLLINLDFAELGCNDAELLTIIVVLMVVAVILVALCVACFLRYRRCRKTVNRSHCHTGSSIATLSQPLSQSKLYRFNSSHSSAIHVMGKEYARPDFIVPLTPSEKIDLPPTIQPLTQTLHGYHSAHRLPVLKDLDMLCSKQPEFVYVHGPGVSRATPPPPPPSVKLQSEQTRRRSSYHTLAHQQHLLNNLNNPCNPYEVVPITGWRTDSMSSFGHVLSNGGSDFRNGGTVGVSCTLRAKPTTEL